MGLDMYLIGKSNGRDDEDLGYWRKHPNLHGYIVQTFADGVDECQPIPLTLEQVQQTLAVTIADDLPQTTGFFFGASNEDDRLKTIEILVAAMRWARAKPGRSIVYQASW